VLKYNFINLTARYKKEMQENSIIFNIEEYLQKHNIISIGDANRLYELREFRNFLANNIVKASKR